MIVRLVMTARAWFFLCFRFLPQVPVSGGQRNAINPGSTLRL
jgi:hypothetical protein